MGCPTRSFPTLSRFRAFALSRSLPSLPGLSRSPGEAEAVQDAGQLRYRSAAGGHIAEHRAFSTLPLAWTDVLAAAALAVCLTALWLGSANAVCSLWAHLLGFWQHALALPARVTLKPYHLGYGLCWSIPYLPLTAAAPDRATWAGSAAATLLLFGGSFFLPRQALPFIYLLRFLSGLQATSLFYFAVAPAAFPHALPDYMADMLAASLALLSTVPALLGFTFYIFPFGLLKKLGLTAMILAHLTLVAPLQYLVQAYCLYRCSLLYMPLFYMVLGLPLDVMMIIAFYGWGMSWEEVRGQRSGVRGQGPGDRGQAGKVPVKTVFDFVDSDPCRLTPVPCPFPLGALVLLIGALLALAAMPASGRSGVTRRVPAARPAPTPCPADLFRRVVEVDLVPAARPAPTPCPADLFRRVVEVDLVPAARPAPTPCPLPLFPLRGRGHPPILGEGELRREAGGSTRLHIAAGAASGDGRAGPSPRIGGGGQGVGAGPRPVSPAWRWLEGAIQRCLLGIVLLISLYTARHYWFTLNRLTGAQRHPYIDIDTADWPAVTVFIAAHNEEAVIEHILEALLEVDYPPDRLLIMPVNDRSIDGTRAIIDAFVARFPGRIHPFHRADGKPGKAAALKDATARVDSEVLVIFDADYIPGKGLIKQIVAPFFDPEIGAVMGRVVPLNTGTNLLTRLLDLERSGGYQVDQQARMNLRLVPQYGGTVGGVRKRALESIGGWLEDTLAEDTDLTYRLLLRGWKTVYQNRAECYEEVPETWPVRARQISRWAKGHNQAMLRYTLPLLANPRVALPERLDGLLLLGIYVTALLLLAGWALSLALFFLAPGPVSGAVTILAATCYSSLGNFAAFFQIAAAARLDGYRGRIRLLPLNIVGFLVSLVCVSGATLAVLMPGGNKRPMVWHKTQRFRKDSRS
jgi:cellulose synthase/poly-beta-1,6-N-acetylglucosamine synthase-like glycosyltransferase